MSDCTEDPVPRNQGSQGNVILKRPWVIALVWLLGVGVWYALYASLAWVAHAITYQVFGLQQGTRSASACEFFVYETPKVLMLLVLVVFGVGIIRSYFTAERTRRLLAGRCEWVGNIFASLLGIVTPFCSCSAVPLFIGFVTTGVPLGVTFSFLIAAPMVNEVALVLLFGLFGWKVAGLYLITGLAVAMIAGRVIGLLKLEHWVESWVYEMQMQPTEDPSLSFQQRIQVAKDAVKDILGKVWVYVLLGIGVGAWIHGYIPQQALASWMGKDAWWAVPMAVLLGVPMYSNAAGMIPIVQALLGKGAALGTVLAFMMAVIALSLPEAIILRKVLQLKLVFVFFGVVAVGIMAVGYLFNACI